MSNIIYLLFLLYYLYDIPTNNLLVGIQELRHIKNAEGGSALHVYR